MKHTILLDGVSVLKACLTIRLLLFTTVLKLKERLNNVNIKSVASSLSRVGNRNLLIAKKHSPTTLFVIGVVGVIATTILASKATLKLDEVMDESQSKIDEIKECDDPDYSDGDRQKDMAITYTKMLVGVAKLYAPAVVIGFASVSALTGSHVIMTRRNVALTAAYATLDRGFREYRQRVSDELGINKEREFRYGVEKHTIVEDTEEGPVTREIKRPTSNSASIYARIFDENSPQWAKDWAYNPIFIKCQQNYMNDLLRTRGHVFLNEVYDALGLPRSKEGCVVGWVNNSETGDGYIDFGVFEGDTHSAMLFVNGHERSILLDFNVDGVIYDKI